jgi:hypothetical protein
VDGLFVLADDSHAIPGALNRLIKDEQLSRAMGLRALKVRRF